MRKRPIAAAAALVAAGLAITGAAAPPASSETTPVSPAIQQLITTGILPTDVTGEPGIWNYAGPAGACPGPGWICVTLGVLPITQIGTVNVIQCFGINCVGSTQTGYANTFQCQPAPGVPFETNTAVLQECVITQGGESNQAKCEQKKKTVPFLRQRCSITQSGKSNQATIVQVADQTVGPTQGALQEAGISQTQTAPGSNQLQVDQEIKQSIETADTGPIQDQDAYQIVGGPFQPGTANPTGAATQTALGGGSNAIQVNQKEPQRAKGGTTQKQNDGEYAAGAPFEEPVDCHVSAVSPANPNACASLEQNSVNGSNQSQLSQTIDQEATTTFVGAVQQQGPGPFEGGADGRVHQVTAAPGSSSNQANQSETLRLVAPTGPPSPTQVQFGGAGCCGFGSQIGPGSEVINQHKLLEAKGGTEQTATLVGTSSSPAGNCAINHNVQTNSDQATAAESADPCPVLAVITTCQNETVGESEEEQVGQCQEVVTCGPGQTPVIEVEEDGDVEARCDEEFIPDPGPD